MQKITKTVKKTYDAKYRVDIIKMIRNNGIAAGKDSLDKYDTYFMLDYFDLLFHKTLTGKDKTYKEFWNIRDSYEKKALNYKAAYKTLSLYTKPDAENGGIFQIQPDPGADFLSTTPFLGIIQINLVYNIFSEEFDAEDTLSACEAKIMEHLLNNMDENNETSYQMYRSSTSGDFCLVVKSSSIEDIYRVSALINHLVIHYNKDNFKLNTYTNTGIACQLNSKGEFMTFCESTISKNTDCEFALRITSDHDFAKYFIRKLQQANKKEPVVKPMEGLFGRYDFLLQIPMKDFAQIYATLCASKIAGKKSKPASPEDYENMSWIEYLKTGIIENKIQIINERALVPLSDTLFTPKELRDVPESAYRQLENADNKLKLAVKNIGKSIKDDLNRFLKMEDLFIEERRIFIDIGRELSELINTYVPQGIENDSHVNWQMLISDLKVVFLCIDKWNASYKECQNMNDRKDMRIHFLDDMRLATDAVHQYYKFLQNINAQTWQSPLYEIQTQLDAEKMMIAYREFLYEYFFDYKEIYNKGNENGDKNKKDLRPMIYPILYPDMSIDIACAMTVLQNTRDPDKRLLICRVPSFEYYGRMFDMIPWILHEASHSIRTLNRSNRNDYLINIVMKSVFGQVLYKFFNKYSNDFGYHQLGALENDILKSITDTAVAEFQDFCFSEKEEEYHELEINYLETNLMEYLQKIFDQSIMQMDEGEDTVNIKSIQAVLLHYLGTLGLLYTEENSTRSIVPLAEKSADHEDTLFLLIKLIHDAYYKKITGKYPTGDQWDFIKQKIDEFENSLKQEQKGFEKYKTPQLEDTLRDYSFTMRELNRLQGAWHKRREGTGNDELRDRLWEKCIPDIRAKIKNGFKDNKGFTELYRILNMEFNSEEATDYANIKKIGQDFNILLHEEVTKLVTREVTIYRETYADLYMVAALGFDVFGYCRQISQTTSDASKENPMQWAIGVNVNRFRTVSAVLLAKEGACGDEKENLYIPMDSLLEKGNDYCHASLDCIQRSIFHKADSQPLPKSKQVEIKNFFKALHQNINDIFTLFNQDELVAVALEDSLLTVYLNPDAKIDDSRPEVAQDHDDAVEVFKSIEAELKDYRHVIFRIKCFIAILNLIGKNGKITIGQYEHEHLKKLYDAHLLNCSQLRKDKACVTVAEYYNDPHSPLTKTPEIMLDDTIHFIQTYYYRNRFKIMSSEEIKGEIN